MFYFIVDFPHGTDKTQETRGRRRKHEKTREQQQVGNLTSLIRENRLHIAQND